MIASVEQQYFASRRPIERGIAKEARFKADRGFYARDLSCRL